MTLKWEKLIIGFCNYQKGDNTIYVILESKKMGYYRNKILWLIGLSGKLDTKSF